MSQPRAPVVVSVNISLGGIPKLPVHAAKVGMNGLEGDGHNHEKHNTPMRALSLIDLEDLNDLRDEGFNVAPGSTGENITVRDLSIDELRPGDRLRFSGPDRVEVELVSPRKPCYVLDAIDPTLKAAIIGRCGFMAKVVREGEIRPGEAIEVVRAAGAELNR